MTTHRMTKMTLGAAFCLLAACGQGETAGNEPAGDATETPAVVDVVNRDWIPAGIILPQPHSVVQDTKVGTRTHLLQLVVETDPKGQFASWQKALEAAGYDVNSSMVDDGRLLFNGADIESGQIAVSQPEDQKGYMIQIDVTKVSP